MTVGPPSRSSINQRTRAPALDKINSAVYQAEVTSEELCILEYFSGSFGKWIPVDITAENPETGSLQINAKPGVWLSLADCKRKLRARTFVPDVDVLEDGCSGPVRKTGVINHIPCVASKSRLSPGAHTAPQSLFPDKQAFQGPSTLKASKGFARPQSGKDLSLPLKDPTPSLPLKRATVQFEPSIQANHVTEVGTARQHYDARGGSFSTVNALPTGNPDEFAAFQNETVILSPSSRGIGGASLSLGAVLQSPTNRRTLSISYACPNCGKDDLHSFEEAIKCCATKVDPTPDSPHSSATDPPVSPLTSRPTGVQQIHCVPGNGQNHQVSDPQPARIVCSSVPTNKEDTWSYHRGPNVMRASEPEGVKTSETNDDDTSEPRSVEGVWGCEVGQDIGGETESTSCSDCHPQALEGEAIAYNTRGEPCIVRHVSPETGAVCTVVRNEDGTQSTFGKNTLSSLMTNTESDSSAWIDSLSMVEKRGLVSQLGHELLSISSLYSFHLQRLQKAADRSNYEYFGLTEDATEKELDNAYRKMAKRMHPDKNGGTEQAKERFQQMKQRYEKLKQTRAERQGGQTPQQADDTPSSQQMDQDESPTNEESQAQDENAAENEKKDENNEADDENKEPQDQAAPGEDKPQRQEAYDDDEQEEPPKDKKEKGTLQYDPTNSESLSEAAVDMLQRLKAIDASMSVVLEQLRHAGL